MNVCELDERQTWPVGQSVGEMCPFTFTSPPLLFFFFFFLLEVTHRLYVGGIVES